MSVIAQPTGRSFTYNYGGSNSAGFVLVDASYLYMVIYGASPCQIIKVNRSTLTVEATWTGATAAQFTKPLIQSDTDLYVGLSNRIERIDKATMSSQANYAPGSFYPSSLVLIGGMLYAGKGAVNPGVVVELDATTLILQRTFTSSLIKSLYQNGLVSDGAGYLYVCGTRIVAPSYISVEKVRISDLSSEGLWVDTEDITDYGFLVYGGGYVFLLAAGEFYKVHKIDPVSLSVIASSEALTTTAWGIVGPVNALGPFLGYDPISECLFVENGGTEPTYLVFTIPDAFSIIDSNTMEILQTYYNTGFGGSQPLASFATIEGGYLFITEGKGGSSFPVLTTWEFEIVIEEIRVEYLNLPLNIPYEDVKGLNTLHLSLTNLSGDDKLEGVDGEVLLEIIYELAG
jgi:hypothetical protein